MSGRHEEVQPTPDDDRGAVIPFPGEPAASIEASQSDRPPADRSTPHVPDRSDTDRVDRSDTDREVLEGEIVLVDDPRVPDRGDWLGELAARSNDRRPVIPAWLRSRQAAGQTARWVARYWAHVAAYHLVRSPLYLCRLVVRTPRGAGRLVAALVRWTWDVEGLPVRLATVRAADPDAYLKLSRQRDARVRVRVPVAILTVLATVAAGLWLRYAAGGLTQAVACLAAVGVCGWRGRPADRPLIDRAVVGGKAERLTSDVVVRALGSLGIGAVNQALAKNPRGGIEFKAPITRDGPGWRAEVDLPHGVTVTEVMDRRDKLASGLRRPLGCVWPEAVPEQHTGRLVLWVGDQDMNTARQPAWPLARTGTVDLFRPVPVATDQRGRPVTVVLMFAAVVIGSIPRMGKTFALRLLCLIAALDPRCRLYLFDLKGTGDLAALEPVAHAYRAGDEDDDVTYGLAAMRELREEMRRRARVIRGLPKDICPESKVTPELASNRSLGLFPVLVAVDECQRWFEHGTHGAELEDICTDLVKRGPALGIVLILATQRPDAKSLPTGISANAVIRMCLKVMGQLENDMVLGTSAYKNGTRATMFSFNDKGIYYLSGEGDHPRIVKGYYQDAPAADRVVARARAARERAGTLSGHALGEESTVDTGPRYDLLADIAAVMTEAKVWNETIVNRLAELRPEAYGPWAQQEPEARAAQLTAALKPYGVRTGQVWGTTDDGRGANRRGIVRDDITTAITLRNQKTGPPGAA